MNEKYLILNWNKTKKTICWVWISRENNNKAKIIVVKWAYSIETIGETVANDMISSAQENCT